MNGSRYVLWTGLLLIAIFSSLVVSQDCQFQLPNGTVATSLEWRIMETDPIGTPLGTLIYSEGGIWSCSGTTLQEYVNIQDDSATKTLSFSLKKEFGEELDNNVVVNPISGYCQLNCAGVPAPGIVTLITFITPVNNRAPTFSPTASATIRLEESMPIGLDFSALLTPDGNLLTAYDNDFPIDPDAMIDFTVDSPYFITLTPAEIRFNDSTGSERIRYVPRLALARQLNAADSPIRFNLIATDRGVPPQSAVFPIEVTITPYDLRDPIFDEYYYTSTIENATEVGSLVIAQGDIHATDGDAVDGQEIKYSILDSDGLDLSLNLTENGGVQVVLNSPVDIQIGTDVAYVVIEAHQAVNIDRKATVVLVVQLPVADPTTTTIGETDTTASPSDGGTTVPTSTCPTFDPSTDCPSTATNCPTFDPVSECPTNETTTVCECSTTAAISTSPGTDCPTVTPVECPTTTNSPSTDCPTSTTTDCSECTATTSSQDCPTIPTDCSTTGNNVTVSTTPDSSPTTTTDCPTCPDFTSTTPSPTDCPVCPSTENPSSTIPTDMATTTLNSDITCPVCPECSTTCPTDCPTDVTCPTMTSPSTPRVDFDRQQYSAEVLENSPVDSPVVQLSASSSDEQAVSYSLKDGIYFKVDPLFGNVTLNQSLAVGSYSDEAIARTPSGQSDSSRILVSVVPQCASINGEGQNAIAIGILAGLLGLTLLLIAAYAYYIKIYRNRKRHSVDSDHVMEREDSLEINKSKFSSDSSSVGRNVAATQESSSVTLSLNGAGRGIVPVAQSDPLFSTEKTSEVRSEDEVYCPPSPGPQKSILKDSSQKSGPEKDTFVGGGVKFNPTPEVIEVAATSSTTDEIDLEDDSNKDILIEIL